MNDKHLDRITCGLVGLALLGIGAMMTFCAMAFFH